MAEDKPKIGAGALQAFLRQGGKEIAQVIPAFKDSVQVIEEPGTIGNLTPGEVREQKQPQKEIELDME